jgi:anti-sigma B factor antagonist
VTERGDENPWPNDFVVTTSPAGPDLPEAYVVSCTGELDMATGPRLREAIDAISDADLIVDLGGLSFIDSTGISILLGTLRRFEEADKRLVVSCPPGAPRRVFELTGLEDVLEICDSRQDAETRMRD